MFFLLNTLAISFRNLDSLLFSLTKLNKRKKVQFFCFYFIKITTTNLPFVKTNISLFKLLVLHIIIFFFPNVATYKFGKYEYKF